MCCGAPIRVRGERKWSDEFAKNDRRFCVNTVSHGPQARVEYGDLAHHTRERPAGSRGIGCSPSLAPRPFSPCSACATTSRSSGDPYVVMAQSPYRNPPDRFAFFTHGGEVTVHRVHLVVRRTTALRGCTRGTVPRLPGAEGFAIEPPPVTWEQIASVGLCRYGTSDSIFRRILEAPPGFEPGMEFCRFREVLYLVDSSCSLVSGVPRFSVVFGR